MTDKPKTAVHAQQKNTVKLAKMAMLVAIALILVNFRFPIFPVVAFLEYDPADIPILIGTFAFGPAAGLMITVVASVLQGLTISAHSGLYGILMHIIATGTFVIVAGLIYKKNKTKKGAVLAIAIGAIAMVAVMAPANYFITPYFMGVPREAVVALFPFILGFNAIKAGVNGVITFFLYKRVSGFMHK